MLAIISKFTVLEIARTNKNYDKRPISEENIKLSG